MSAVGKSSSEAACDKRPGEQGRLCDAAVSVQHEVLQRIPAGVGIFTVKNDDVRLEYLNDGYYRMIGTMRSHRVRYSGANTLGAVHAQDRSGLLEETQKAIREKQPLRYRYRLLYEDGIYRWIGIRAQHEPLPDGSERFYVAYFDIHDLMQTQRKLEANERAFQELFSCSDFLYFTYYPQEHCYKIMVLPEKLRELPLEMEDFPESLILYAGLSPEDGDAYRRMVRRIDAGAKEAQCDIRFRYMGSYKWYRVHMLNFAEADGKPDKVLCYAMEIGQLKEAERLLAEEKLRMKSMASGSLAVSCFNVTRDFAVQISKKGKLSYDVPLYAALEEEALLAEPRIAEQRAETRRFLFAAASQIPDQASRIRFLTFCSHAGMKRAYEEGKREVILEYQRMTAGGLCWVKTRIALLPDTETGDVLAFYYTSDINERKIRQEVSLRLLGNGFSYACYIEPSNGKLYRLEVKEISAELHLPQAETYDEARQMYIPGYVHPEDQVWCMKESELSRILQVLEREPVHTIHYRMQRPENGPSGAWRRMETRIFYLNEERQYLVFGFSDVTEQYEREQQRKEVLERAARKAQSASEAKTNFLARMSHDIRTPLNGIIGMTGLAMEEENIAQIKEYLRKIDESSHFLLALVNDILDMSKVESGKMELHPEPYSYPELHQYITAVISPLAERRGVHFTISNPYAEGIVRVDKLRLNQIVFNLLSNAVKFTPAGGHVVLEFSRHKVEAGQMSVDISVRDDGAGMSEEFQKKLFQPFEQEYTSHNAKRNGSGLGLAIVRSLVTLMGGTISVRSAPGKGSEFSVHLTMPLVEEKIMAATEHTEEISLTGCRFLVAEDNDINSEIVLTLLLKKGASAVRARDGKEALQMLEASEPHTFDAILMDVQMPGMDGLEASRRIRSLERRDAAAVPIIAMTANAYDEDVCACLAAGMNAHIAKPIDTGVMFRTLAKYVRAKAK